MKNSTDARKLIDFISSSPSPYHVVENMAKKLSSLGYRELDERGPFNLEKGQCCFVRRNSSSMIAFRIPQERFTSFHCVSAHTDSPTFKIKPNPVDTSSSHYSTLNVETYGGLVLNSWFDRPLSIAGRVYVRTDRGPEERLVDFDRDLVSIPSLAIHQNRQVNDGVKISVQKEMKPLLSCDMDRAVFLSLLSDRLCAGKDDILDYDLFLYNRTQPGIWGAEGEFVSSPKLDDLMCAYSAFRALCEAEGSPCLDIIALFDNEETGSSSRQGALSDFLFSTLRRICLSLSYSEEEMYMLFASSNMLSSDNGHALHPNYTEKCDITNKPVINGGVIIKYSANQKYTTDASTGAYVKDLMIRNGIPYQIFVNNSDVTGGSTLGNLSMHQVSIPTCDIGLAQLSMHSSYECAGVEDASYIYRLFKAYFEEQGGR